MEDLSFERYLFTLLAINKQITWPNKHDKVIEYILLNLLKANMVKLSQVFIMKRPGKVLKWRLDSAKWQPLLWQEVRPSRQVIGGKMTKTNQIL